MVQGHENIKQRLNIQSERIVLQEEKVDDSREPDHSDELVRIVSKITNVANIFESLMRI